MPFYFCGPRTVDKSYRPRPEGHSCVTTRYQAPISAVHPGSVRELIEAITRFIDGWNQRCEPFVWTKDADTIIAKANRKSISDTRHWGLFRKSIIGRRRGSVSVSGDE